MFVITNVEVSEIIESFDKWLSSSTIITLNIKDSNNWCKILKFQAFKDTKPLQPSKLGGGQFLTLPYFEFFFNFLDGLEMSLLAQKLRRRKFLVLSHV